MGVWGDSNNPTQHASIEKAKPLGSDLALDWVRLTRSLDGFLG